MTVFAICMTAIAAFLMGAAVKEKTIKGKTKIISKEPKRCATSEISDAEYRNFLSYDGSEQA